MKNEIDIKAIIRDQFFNRQISEEERKAAEKVERFYEELSETLNDDQKKLLLKFDNEYINLKADEEIILIDYIFDLLRSIWR